MSQRKAFHIAHLINEQFALLESQRLNNVWNQTSSIVERCVRFINLRHKLHKAMDHHYDIAAQRVRLQMQHCLNDLQSQCAHVSSRVYTPAVHVAMCSDIVRDLEQLTTEFNQWTYDTEDDALSVVTHAIELEGVYLGSFKIVLRLRDISSISERVPYEVIATDPHPATSSDAVTHPHISDKYLCAGDATTAITNAIQSGRICDFFILVRSVLTTYNPDSPYVSLENWRGESCPDCGEMMHEDNRYWCEMCDNTFCDECTGGCRCCDLTACFSCLSPCPSCDEYTCKNCLRDCIQCGTRCCCSCLDDDLCPSCYEEQENENEEEQETNSQANQETTLCGRITQPPQASTSLHPLSMGETPLLLPSRSG